MSARRHQIPCTVVDLAIRVYHDPPVIPCHVVIFGTLHVPEVSVRSPEKLGWVSGHRKRLAEVVLKLWIVPPLTQEDI